MGSARLGVCGRSVSEGLGMVGYNEERTLIEAVGGASLGGDGGARSDFISGGRVELPLEVGTACLWLGEAMCP